MLQHKIELYELKLCNLKDGDPCLKLKHLDAKFLETLKINTEVQHRGKKAARQSCYERKFSGRDFQESAEFRKLSPALPENMFI